MSTLGTDMGTVVTDESADKAPSPEVSKRIEEVSERIKDAAVSDLSIICELTDGRSVSAPLFWSRRREGATEEGRQDVQISPRGYRVRWPDVDEGLSARGALRGTPAPRPSTAPPAETPSEWTPGRIQKLRHQRGMSQTAFAERMGVWQATMSDWETGRQEPSPMARRLLDRIATAADDNAGSS
jgi:DNA-binding transcriptional regulator YiaG